MFGELPKVFDRNFAISYFLPVTAFLGLSYFLLQYYGLVPGMVQSLTEDLLKGAVVLSLLSYLGGVLLLVLNGDIYSFLSGYGKFNPFRLFQSFEVRRFRKMIGEIHSLDFEYFTEHFSERSLRQRSRLLEEIVNQFPDQEPLVQPTPFGNMIRAVHVYPRTIYGMDYSGCWSRMLAVIPVDYRNIVEESKGQVDFWINTYLLSVCILLEIIIVWYFTGSAYLLVSVLPLILLATLFMVRAQSAVQVWGIYVCTAFDVYRNKLREMLELPRPRSHEEERAMWTRFSHAIMYRSRESLPEIDVENSPSPKIRSNSSPRKKAHRAKSR